MQKTLRIIVQLLVILIFNNSIGQVTYTVNTKLSEIAVTGTSTLHDWEMKVTELNGKLNGKLAVATDKSITDVQLSCNANKLKSTEGKTMDDKAHEALKAANHPNITFSFISISIPPSNTATFNGNITGLLTIAGKTIKTTLPFSGSIQANGDLLITSSFSLNMTTFNITPPALMFGSIKTGDKITLKTKIHFTKTL